MRQVIKRLLLLAMISCLAGCTAKPDNNNIQYKSADNVQNSTQNNTANTNAPMSRKNMTAFRSQYELASYFRELAEQQQRGLCKAGASSYNGAALPAPS